MMSGSEQADSDRAQANGDTNQSPWIVVGFDGSPDARSALTWAIREAGARDMGVRVVHAEPPITGMDAVGGTLSGSQAAYLPLEHHVDQLLSAAEELAREAGVPVSTFASEGATVGALVAESRSARMVVLGSRGVSTLSSALLGSTVSHVSAHAHCPVIVVMAGGDPQGPVVVGIDGSQHSQVLLGWAMAHAQMHSLPVEVLHCYAVPVYPGVVPYVPPVELSEAMAEMEEGTAAAALAPWRDQFPDVPVTLRVLHGRPAQELTSASSHASLTVVGSHGRGAFMGMLLGSTSQSLLHHAKGTVAILRGRH